jgi:hypothetical protein
MRPNLRKQMKRFKVQSLNECFNIDGPIWIENDPSSYTQTCNCNPLTTFKPGHQTNKGRPTSELQKKKARENALRRNKNQKGANNRNAKTWKIIFEDGREIIIKSIHDWAKEHGYSKSGIRNLFMKKWKRYKDIVTIEEVAHDSL